LFLEGKLMKIREEHWAAVCLRSWVPEQLRSTNEASLIDSYVSSMIFETFV
jgi:hypothetical protein